MADDTVDLCALDEVHFQQQESHCPMWVRRRPQIPVVYHHPMRKSATGNLSDYKIRIIVMGAHGVEI